MNSQDRMIARQALENIRNAASTLERLQGVEGSEQELVGESRSDGPASDAEKRSGELKPNTYEEVHVTTDDGRSIYWPKGDMTRLAPAAVCNVASRMLQLRKAINADPFDMREVERLIAAPISFEKEFLSGDSLTVHNAIKALGIEALPAPSVPTPSKTEGGAYPAVAQQQHSSLPCDG